MLFSSCLLWKTLFFISLAVLLTDFTEIRAFASPSECKSATINDMNESLEKYSKCFNEMIAKGEKASINFLVWRLQEMLDPLRTVQEKFCKQLPPCPRPLAPRNGGLVCVTIDNAQYCKPMCNKGYDFQFLRRSRLYEVCGNATGFSWTSQLFGGKALAVCNPSEIAVSGAKSAYFPTNSTCLRTLAFTETQTEHLNTFLKELDEQGIDSSSRDKESDCIICDPPHPQCVCLLWKPKSQGKKCEEQKTQAVGCLIVRVKNKGNIALEIQFICRAVATEQTCIACELL